MGCSGSIALVAAPLRGEETRPDTTSPVRMGLPSRSGADPFSGKIGSVLGKPSDEREIPFSGGFNDGSFIITYEIAKWNPLQG